LFRFACRAGISARCTAEKIITEGAREKFPEFVELFEMLER
jgi:hypothetical protein